ncbi:TPA: ABC transporter ATP-binding protein [Candidatus Poribacteria bacterium]|nr:ABC transporter ATP-binding protein [Candidatus Poribacteria bacterium]
MPVVEVQNLRVRYGDLVALDGVSLKVEGGAVGLLGPNGAGKSTLLKTLLGLLRPDEGRCMLFGQDVSADAKGIRRRIGYMPEENCLIPEMTGVQFVSYMGRLSGMKGEEAMSRAHDVLFYVGLGEERYRKLKEYSAGMLQRIKFAQAIVHDPDLLLLDEPTGGMDPPGRREMLELIREVTEDKGINAIISTHLLPDVEGVCDEVILLDRGRLIMQKRMDELRREMKEMYLVRIRGDPDRFGKALSIYGITVISGGEDLRVRMPEGGSPSDILKAACEADVQVRRMEPMRSSLESLLIDLQGGFDRL